MPTGEGTEPMRTKLTLVGIAGTAKDFLLAPPLLKAHIDREPRLRAAYDAHAWHESFFPPHDRTSLGRIADDLAGAGVDVIGFSCYIWNFEAVAQLTRGLRARGSTAKIVLGGPEITREEIEAGRFDTWDVDYLVFGEGEKPLSSLLLALLELENGGLATIKGLAYRDGKGFRCHPQPDLIEDLTQAASAILDGAVPEAVLTRPQMRINLETQRGCSFRCAYCFYHQGSPKIRYRDPLTVLDELESVTARGMTEGRLVDANFLSSKQHSHAILRGLVERDIRMKLLFEALPPFVDEEAGDLIGAYIANAPGNAISVAVGIQSLNREALKIIRRAMRVSVFERALGILQRCGAVSRVDLILGLPREAGQRS